MSRLQNYRESVLQLGYDAAKAMILTTAFELDLFERIGKNTKTALTLAEELKANPASLELFLNACVSIGLLEADGSGFQNTKHGLEIFLKGKPLFVGDYVRLQAKSIRDWLSLKTAVLSGQPMDQPDFFKVENSEATAGFAQAMHNTAMGHAEFLAKRISLRGMKTLLDLGGGPGTFTIHFLKENPNLEAVIFDLPQTLETTRTMIGAYRDMPLRNRVRYQAGDFNRDEIQGTFDVCFLSHIIHGQGEEENKKLFRNVFHHLHPGGRFIVQDFFLNADRSSPQFAAVFALNMLIHTEDGRTYTFDDVEGWMREAGFLKCSRLNLKLPRSISLMIGEKQ